MPRGDGTGPTGAGPMTGRAAGYCAGSGVPGFMERGIRRGLGMAWGRGGAGGMGMAWRRGWGSGAGGRGWGFFPGPVSAPYAAGPSSEGELEVLREQADWLKQQTEAVNARLQELQKPQD